MLRAWPLPEALPQEQATAASEIDGSRHQASNKGVLPPYVGDLQRAMRSATSKNRKETFNNNNGGVNYAKEFEKEENIGFTFVAESASSIDHDKDNSPGVFSASEI